QQCDIDRKAEQQENEGNDTEGQDHRRPQILSEACSFGSTVRPASSSMMRQSVISAIKPKPTASAMWGIHIGRLAKSLRRSMACMTAAYLLDCDISTIMSAMTSTSSIQSRATRTGRGKRDASTSMRRCWRRQVTTAAPTNVIQTMT